MTPKDCKENASMTPVYDLYSYGYRNRRSIECDPEHIELLFNNGYTERPPTQLGIMALEGRNNVLNRWNYRLCAGNVSGAILHSQIFEINNT